jgi:uncharacterized protein YkwD
MDLSILHFPIYHQLQKQPFGQSLRIMKTTTCICAAVLAFTLAFDSTIGEMCHAETTNTPTMVPVITPAVVITPAPETIAPATVTPVTMAPVVITPAPVPATPAPVVNDDTTSGSEYSIPCGLNETEQDDMLARINAVRAENGRQPLKINAVLMDVAYKHSQQQASKCEMSHNLGTNPGERIEASGYKSKMWAENVAAGQKTVDDVMKSWIESPGHFENLVNTDAKEVGFGKAENKDCGDMIEYWTQVFGSSDTVTPVEATVTPDPVIEATPAPVVNGHYTRGSDYSTPCGLNHAEQEEMLARINAVRAENGRQPLKINAVLMDVAYKHSQEQAAKCEMGHNLGSSPGERIEASGYKSKMWAENVAAGQKTVDDVMKSWIESPGHFENLIKTDAKEVGFGKAENKDCGGMSEYWTQVFG